MSKNSLDREKDEGNISFIKSFPPIQPSLHNFFLDVSSIVDIAKIVKEKE